MRNTTWNERSNIELECDFEFSDSFWEPSMLLLAWNQIHVHNYLNLLNCSTGFIRSILVLLQGLNVTISLLWKHINFLYILFPVLDLKHYLQLFPYITWTWLLTIFQQCRLKIYFQYAKQINLHLHWKAPINFTLSPKPLLKKV